MRFRGLTRRQFLISGSALAAFFTTGFTWPWRDRKITGQILGASSPLGHKLRDGYNFPSPSETIKKDAVIVGGGIAGLSAAWKLRKAGLDNFTVLELEKDVGGNSHYGENAVSAYPWGAHYVPLLTDESTAARELFADLGVITGYDEGLPIYNEYYLSADPQERLYMYGRWQEGIVPATGLTPKDKAQYAAFFSHVESFKNKKGSDGKKAFAIPLDKSSSDLQFRDLDKLSIAEYMKQRGWDSEPLNWYVDYCCRDDYGATKEEISAWAGIHYFAARTGKGANAMPTSVITWPEGNGFIVRQLKEKLGANLKTQALVYAIENNKEGVSVRYFDVANNRTIQIDAKAVIIAAPQFIARRLTKDDFDAKPFQYSPWMVANVTLDAVPQGRGADLAWDNMIYGSRLLGYVVATHQNLNRIQDKTVLTYYWPLSHLSPADARKEALARPYEEWRDIVLKELLTIHPELRGQVRNVDIWLWGHGMIRPEPGFIWGEARQKALKSSPPVFHAHSDMSGISIFEEANAHGVAAAESLMAHLHHPFQTSL
ncbi:MAG TPA: FAD-dependent oxidoreductase [Patescibacteria group bacterium]|nr:FAD-dependent oxidoreductase [Patescibacteria group bacterium]